MVAWFSLGWEPLADSMTCFVIVQGAVGENREEVVRPLNHDETSDQVRRVKRCKGVWQPGKTFL